MHSLASLLETSGLQHPWENSSNNKHQPFEHAENSVFSPIGSHAKEDSEQHDIGPFVSSKHCMESSYIPEMSTLNAFKMPPASPPLPRPMPMIGPETAIPREITEKSFPPFPHQSEVEMSSLQPPHWKRDVSVGTVTGIPSRSTSGGVGADLHQSVNLPSVLLSVLKQQNIDYKNDFYWLTRFKHEKMLNAHELERSILLFQQERSNMAGLAPSHQQLHH